MKMRDVLEFLAFVYICELGLLILILVWPELLLIYPFALLFAIFLILSLTFWMVMLGVALEMHKPLWALLGLFIPIVMLYFYYSIYRPSLKSLKK